MSSCKPTRAHTSPHKLMQTPTGTNDQKSVKQRISPLEPIQAYMSPNKRKKRKNTSPKMHKNTGPKPKNSLKVRKTAQKRYKKHKNASKTELKSVKSVKIRKKRTNAPAHHTQASTSPHKPRLKTLKTLKKHALFTLFPRTFYALSTFFSRNKH